MKIDTRLENITKLIEDLEVLNSLYDVKVLSHLILALGPKTASEMSKELNIPDSKIYPALNNLYNLDLILVNDNKRPKEYSFNQPEKLHNYLSDTIQEKYNIVTSKLHEISDIVSQVWHPEEYMLDNIAQLYRGEEINNELARHLKLTKDHLFIFLSTKFKHYDILMKYLAEISHDNFRLEIVVPVGYQEFISYLDHEVNGKIKMRTSIWNQNSYVIRDHKIMMNMFHSEQDVVLLTNDELMVRNVRQCWDDPDCCTTTDLIELKLPEKFNLHRIELP